MNITFDLLLDMLIEIIAAFGGTFAYGFLFNIRGKKLILGAIGGMLAWALVLVMRCFYIHEVLIYFIVSLAMTVYSEVLARIVKTPSTTFCIVTLVSLIPGGTLYYAMSYALRGDTEMFAQKAILTLQLTIALSLGIVLVTACSRYAARVRAEHGKA